MPVFWNTYPTAQSTKCATDFHEKDVKEKNLHTCMNSDITSMFIEKIENQQSNPQASFLTLVQLFKDSCSIKVS